MERLRNDPPTVNMQPVDEDQARMLRARQGQLVGRISRRGGLIRLTFGLGGLRCESPPVSDRKRI